MKALSAAPDQVAHAPPCGAADNARYVNLRNPSGPGGSLAPMTPDDLVEIELIKRLKYKYARCLDQKLWDEIAECFTADAYAAYSGGGYSFEGRDAIVDFLCRSMGAETFHSSHKMHHPEIDLTGPDTAHGVWALDDVVVMTDFELTIRGCSFYDDDYVKQDGAWRIQRTGLQASLRGDPAPGQRRGPPAHGLVVVDGWSQLAPGRLTSAGPPYSRITSL